LFNTVTKYNVDHFSAQGMALKIGKYSAWLELRERKSHEQLRESPDKHRTPVGLGLAGRGYGNMRDESMTSDMDSGRQYESPTPGYKTGKFIERVFFNF
jgi:hypothetical protein